MPKEHRYPDADLNDPILQAKFLEIYSKIGELRETCRKMHISISHYHEWKKAHPEFQQKLVDIRIEWLDEVSAPIEEQMRQLALNGDREAGKWWLERRLKGRWANKVHTEVSNPDGSMRTVQVTIVEDHPPEKLKEIVQEAIQKVVAKPESSRIQEILKDRMK